MPAETEFVAELTAVLAYTADTRDVGPLRELTEEAARREDLSKSSWLLAKCELERELCRERDAADAVMVWEGLARHAAGLPDEDPARLVINTMRAKYVKRRGHPGDPERAAELYRREWERRRRLLPEEDPRLSTARANYAVAVRDRGRPGDIKEALGILEEETKRRVDRFGAHLPFTWIAHVVLAQTLILLAEETDDPEERRRLAAEAADNTHDKLTQRRRRFGWSHAATLRAQVVRAHALVLTGDLTAAIEILDPLVGQEKAMQIEPGRCDLLLARAHREGHPVKALHHAGTSARLAVSVWQRTQAEKLVAELTVT
ncbi:hypothetical protein [Actinomadura harenae]|uniref:Uncharacterized protein n=1 Tax=Actinomadura harenae TaxID=2483351 RepID=A0A3M2LM68_9ACTN|nr:hypothetical protein [Actinomadura harenae]RMI38216.1 hypothetical protein EBO15_33630 [Actinomadura harenae]